MPIWRASSTATSRRSRWIARATLSATLVLLQLGSASTHAQSDSGCETPLLRKLLTVEERLEDNTFTVDRNLSDYLNAFDGLSPHLSDRLPLMDALIDLRPGDVWIDFGAGEAQATLGYLSNSLFWPHGTPARVVAIGYKKPEVVDRLLSTGIAPQHRDRFTYLHGRYIEDIPDEEIPRFALATDYFGPYSYTRDVSGVLNKYLRRMQNRDSKLLIYGNGGTHFFRPDRRRDDLFRWLTRHEGIRVTRPYDNHDALVIQKLRDDVQLPELHLAMYDDAAPPIRNFTPTPETHPMPSTRLQLLRTYVDRKMYEYLEDYASELRRVSHADRRYTYEYRAARKALRDLRRQLLEHRARTMPASQP